jgi:hypothetical protein
MNEERRQILNMLAAGQISAEDAERLLDAVGSASDSDAPLSAGNGNGGGLRYFRVVIDAEDEKEGPVKVNVRVPIKLIRAGVQLSSLIPQQARGHIDAAMEEKGVDFDLSQITPENLDDIVAQLRDLTVDVDSQSAKVRVYCE